jgi:hypothetical protein
MRCIYFLFFSSVLFRLLSPSVIASEAKQSRVPHTILDCFVASLLAMTAKLAMTAI